MKQQAHFNQGKLSKALQILQKLQLRGNQDYSQTIVCLLQGCIKSNALDDGRLLHDHLIRNEWRSNVFISTAIVNMYARCGNIEDAEVVFSKMSERNVVTWNMMIAAYCKHEKFDDAVYTFWRMQKDGTVPNDVSFVSSFKACAGLENLDEGRKVHDLFRKSKINLDTLVGNSLINMYVKCGSFKEAQQVFDSMIEKDSASWNVMIGGYMKMGDAKKSLELFSWMQATGVKPDTVTFLSILNACASLGDFKEAQKIHDDIKKSGLVLNILIWNALIDMHAKCRSWSSAWRLFHDIRERDSSTWNAMVGGLSKHGYCEEALQLLLQMAMEGFCPNDISYVSALTACATSQALEHGKRIHSQIAKTSAITNTFVGNSLVDMYAKCGKVNYAWDLFNEISNRSVVSWNTIIANHVKHDYNEEVLQLFQSMIEDGSEPDEVTYVSLVNACANLTSVYQGFQVHNCIVISKYEHDIFVGNALIDMYAKCGKLEDADRVLERMPEKDIVSWNTMLAGYAQHGFGQEAVELASEMLKDNMKLNHVSFVALLTACSHSGLVGEGWYYFDFMTWNNGVEQAIEHYSCMIDLLARAGQLYEAEKLLKCMPLEANNVLWRTLLGACGIHGNIEFAMQAAAQIPYEEPHVGTYL